MNVSFPDSAYRIADNAIGKTLKVRLDKNRFVKGRIANCEPHRWTAKVTREHVVFRVVLKCGVDEQTTREVFITKLPR